MYLQSINISGFRSFGQPVKLELHCGFNALVGPNLCGKSNFIDALSWSLGISNEDFPPEDILFRGAKARAPMLATSVRLSLLETGKQSNGLTVSRHLYHSRNQEGYRINDLDPLLASLPEPQAKLLEHIHLISDRSDLIQAAEKTPRGNIFIFDGIDDDLTDNERKNFTGALSRLRGNNQIIMVTHSKLSLQEADQVTGITMEEYGISKFLAMRFQ